MSEVLQKQEEHRSGKRPGSWLAGVIAMVAVLVTGASQLAGQDERLHVSGVGVGKSSPVPADPETAVLGSQASRSLLEAPLITSGPREGQTSDSNVGFSYSHPQNGVNFACSLDNAPFTRCSRDGISYSGLPAGPHFFAVSAQQGNGALGAPAGVNWSVGTPAAPAPPSPVITSGPRSSTIDPDATLFFTNGRAGVAFECRMDGTAFSPCESPKSYADLEAGAHTFLVRAIDSAGTSAAASYGWTIVEGGFGISGDVVGLLAPGVTLPLNLTFTNPFSNSQGLNISDLRISVEPVTMKDGEPNLACIGSENVTVHAGSAWAINVPRNSIVSLADLQIPQSAWPQVAMLNLDSNQDACKNTIFTFSYTGTASK